MTIEAVIKRTASNRTTTRAIQREAQQHLPALPAVGLSKESVLKLSPLVAPVSGFLAAFSEISLLFPTEYCKVQLQLNRSNPNFSIWAHLKERRFAIYKGLPPMLIGAPLQGFLRFASLDYITHHNSMQALPAAVKGVTAGILAGIVESVLVVTPMETVKTKLIDSNMSLTKGVPYIIKEQGFRGLYAGVMPTILKSASNQAFRFVVFNSFKDWKLNSADRVSKTLKPMESLQGGVLAGLIGCLLNTPFDVVKSRMQGMDSKRYKNLFNCAATMVKEEGILSLYKGLAWRSARVVPGQGVIFLVYDQTSKYLHHKIESYE